MKLNEIKKTLYREKPIAKLTECSNSMNYYTTSFFNGTQVYFEVPHNDMGHAEFKKEMPANLLIRWIVGIS